MADLLLEPLPAVWEGRAIDPDFRPMVWLSDQLRRHGPDRDPAALAHEALRRFYRDPVPLHDAPEAFAALERFYLAGFPPVAESARKGSESGSDEVCFDYAFDAPFIVAAFQQAYHIDLTSARLHWFRFLALFHGLPETTKFSRILEIRQKDTSRMTGEELEVWEELKDLYALPAELKGGRRIVTVQEHDEAFLERFRAD